MKRKKKIGSLRLASRFMLMWVIALLAFSIVMFFPSCSVLIKKTPEKYMEIGKKNVDKKDYKKAHKNYSKAIDANRSLFVAYWERGLVDIKMDSLENAIDDIGMYIESGPDRTMLARAYSERGDVLFKAGYKVDACEDWTNSCQIGFGPAPCEKLRLKCK